MNELISSFAGKRLAAFAALVAAIALLAGGGAFSIGTAQAQGADEAWGTSDDGFVGRGLDHINADGTSAPRLSVTLVTGFRHTVCLMVDINAQQFRADTQSGSPADGTPGAAGDVDDLDWDTTTGDIDQITVAAAVDGVDRVSGDTTTNVRGPRGILTSAPSGSPPAIGWNWVISQKTGTAGTPTVANSVRRFQNAGPGENGTAGLDADGAFEACVYWTSTAPGTQIVQLYQANDLRAAGNRVLDIEHGDNTLAAISAANVQLEVVWVDADPAIIVNRTNAEGMAIGASVVSAPIAQRMVFTGAGYTQAQVNTWRAGPDGTLGDDPDTAGDDESEDDREGRRVITAGTFEPASGNLVGSDTNNTPTTVVLAVNAFQDPETSDAQLTGTMVTFAVAGTCGMVTVPGVTGTGITDGNLSPGQTGAIARWSGVVNATFSNTGAGAAACRLASSTTTLTITAGAATQDVTVNWDWDGYGEYTVEDVGDEGTTKKVTFHTAIPRAYSRSGRPIGWACDEDSQARTVAFDLDGRASVSNYARRNTVGTDGPSITTVTPTSTGAAPPKRTLGATDSECQVAWTVRSPARASDVYIDITSAGVPAFSELLSFAPEAAPSATFADFDPPLVPGTDLKRWTGESTPVGDAIGDSGATAIYEWISASQSWVSYFPGSEGLGVNTLTMLRTDGVYFIVTPRN